MNRKEYAAAAQQVARTILAQLGGNKFVAMTGANSFSSSIDSLSFRIPRKGACIITLNADDTYTMEFKSMKGSFAEGNVRCETTRKYEGLYCDMLAIMFGEFTGLATGL